jgi:hypothetical protein
MNATIEKIDTINIPESNLQKTEEGQKKACSKNQLCLKILDYFVF